MKLTYFIISMAKNNPEQYKEKMTTNILFSLKKL